MQQKKYIDLIVEISEKLQKGYALLLFGSIGSGKTFFTSQLCNMLDVKQNVSSPTYTLINSYDVIIKNQKHLILHSDLYRIHCVDLSLFSQIYSQDTISIIEWAEKLDANILLLMPNRLHLHFTNSSNNYSISLQEYYN